MSTNEPWPNNAAALEKQIQAAHECAQESEKVQIRKGVGISGLPGGAGEPHSSGRLRIYSVSSFFTVLPCRAA